MPLNLPLRVHVISNLSFLRRSPNLPLHRVIHNNDTGFDSITVDNETKSRTMDYCHCGLSASLRWSNQPSTRIVRRQASTKTSREGANIRFRPHIMHLETPTSQTSHVSKRDSLCRST